MKEHLTSLKESTIKVMSAREKLIKQIIFFNLKVEERKNNLNIEELYNSNDNSYEAAKFLNNFFPQIKDMVLEIRKEHPKYGEKRIKELVLTELLNQYKVSDKSQLEIVLDNYLLYENCGFFPLQQQENEIILLETDIKNHVEDIIDESKEVVIKNGDVITNIIKPYGEVAKSQLDDASKFAKSIINKGSKQLVKIFKDIQDKTNEE